MSVNSRYLVETDWLESHLGNPTLRILDCTVFVTGDDRRVVRESGRHAWEEGHIPGSGFADLLEDLSDKNSRIPLMMPAPDRISDVMSLHGVGQGSMVVLYDAQANMSATRLWWMLKAIGFDNAMVLNGGWRKWIIEKRPVSVDPPTPRYAYFIPRPRSWVFVNKRDVVMAIRDPETCIVDALTAEQHLGTIERYGRPGRIPKSVNVPAGDIISSDTDAYLPAEELRRKFAEAGVIGSPRVITYCGSSLAASSVAFALHLLGYENVAIYDGSLEEWAADLTLPMEMG